MSGSYPRKQVSTCPAYGCQSVSNYIEFSSERREFFPINSSRVLHNCYLCDSLGYCIFQERKWEEFSHLLWSCLGVTLQKRSSWHISTALMEALQIIHKSLKNENDDLAEVNLRFALQSILNFSWDFLHEIPDAQEKALSPSDNIKGLFLAANIRLLCSLVEKTSMEAGLGLLDDSSVYIKVTTLVYDLLAYCFSIYCRFNIGLSQYIRHKSLVSIHPISSFCKCN